MPRVVAPWFAFAVAGVSSACASDSQTLGPFDEVGDVATSMQHDAGGQAAAASSDASHSDANSEVASDADVTPAPADVTFDAPSDTEAAGDGQAATDVEAPRPPHEAGIVDQLVRDIGGREVDLRDYRGRPLLIVNVASRCGYTPQYADLQEIYETYSVDGLEILAFPSNQFGAQEPGTEEEISEFCTTNYGITFPLFAKIDVNGNKRDPVYRTLCEESAAEFNGDIAWNFTKFLISAEGEVVGRWASSVLPTSAAIVEAIERELGVGPNK